MVPPLLNQQSTTTSILGTYLSGKKFAMRSSCVRCSSSALTSAPHSSSFFRTMKHKFASPVTSQILPKPIARQLSSTFLKRNFSSRYWFTLPQLQRHLGSVVRRGERPCYVTPGSTAVFHVNQLTPNSCQELLKAHPPYFGHGVGIFHRWSLEANSIRRRLENFCRSTSNARRTTTPLQHRQQQESCLAVTCSSMRRRVSKGNGC